MTGQRGGRFASLEWQLGLIAGLIALAWALVLLDPFASGTTVDPDATSSVLYFERIAAFRLLEGFVPTTPKPLLTLVYGLTWQIGHDWRWLTLETMAIFGASVGLGAALVARLVGRIASAGAERGAVPATSAGSAGAGWDAVPAGGDLTSPLGRVAWRTSASSRSASWAAVAGAAAVTAGLLGSSDLLLEVSRANSLVWALALWLVAGLAMSARPARPWLAGIALFLAALCRLETLALDALAVAILVVAAWRARRGEWPMLTAGLIESGEHLGRRRAAVLQSGALGVAIALAAIPVMLLHDWLLTGNPLWFLSVPAGYTAIYNPGLAAVGPLEFTGVFLGREASTISAVGLIVLAALGVWGLVRGRETIVASAIATLAGSVTVLLFVLAARATYISNRYYEPLDLALLLGTAIATGWLAGLVLERLAPRLVPRPPAPVVEIRAEGAGLLEGIGLTGRVDVGRAPSSSRAMLTAGILATVAAVALVVGLTWAPLPFDRRATTELSNVRLSSRHLAAVLPSLVGPLRAAAAAAPDSGPAGGAAPVVLRSLAVLVPSRDVSRIAVEQHSRVTIVGDVYAFLLNAGLAQLQPGQVVVHDGSVDRPPVLYRPLEVDGVAPVTTADGLTLVPRLHEVLAGDLSTGIWVVEVR